MYKITISKNNENNCNELLKGFSGIFRFSDMYNLFLYNPQKYYCMDGISI